MNWFFLYTAIGWLIRAGMLPTVLRRNFAPGASMAWLAVVFLHPYIGLALYQLFGENRLGPGRVSHHAQLMQRYAATESKSEIPAEIPDGSCSLIEVAKKVGKRSVVSASAVEFITDSSKMVERLAADIDAATSHVHLLYYIMGCDATGQRIVVALKNAANRGVKCRLILDAFASRADFGRRGFVSDLKAAGVEVIAALPSSLLRRRDLRNHRKLAIIDDRVSFAGSHNLINPDYGGKHGGPWVDLTGRFTGPVVAEHASMFLIDWAFETNQELNAPSPANIPSVEGGTSMQVVPTGPTSPSESFRRLFLGIVDSAQHRLVLTTPYFVPDEATVLALLGAADRGVDVTLIVPETSDNLLTAAAGRANYPRLMEAGISIFLYKPGLIHAKLATVDDRVAVLGSANLDVRSFHLNFELTTLAFDAEVTERLRAIQQTYITDSRQLNASDWCKRPVLGRYADLSVALISPLL